MELDGEDLEDTADYLKDQQSGSLGKSLKDKQAGKKRPRVQINYDEDEEEELEYEYEDLAKSKKKKTLTAEVSKHGGKKR